MPCVRGFKSESLYYFRTVIILCVCVCVCVLRCGKGYRPGPACVFTKISWEGQGSAELGSTSILYRHLMV